MLTPTRKLGIEKVALLFAATISATGVCVGEALARERVPIRILIDPKPVSLDPYRAIDATSQRINALLFRGLVKQNVDLALEPDLAQAFAVSSSGRTLRFTWPAKSPSDVRGQPITAAQMVACLESYRGSPHASALPTWQSTQLENPRTIAVHLHSPDPYALRNLVLLRFFRVAGIETPCAPTAPGVSLIGSGLYKVRGDRIALGLTGDLLSLQALSEVHPDLELHFVLDETAKIAALLRGKVDLALSSLGIEKTRWLRKRHADRFSFIDRAGSNVQYVAFSQKDPQMRDPRVRKALALAVDRDLILRTRMRGFAQGSQSFLAPFLPEAARVKPLAYDPQSARLMLEQAGFSAEHPLHLKYKTTPNREGIEIAQILRDFWRKIGVDVSLEIVEPAAFLQAVRKGSASVYSSRWIGVADGSILYQTLRTGQKNNRVGYSSPEVDHWLDEALKNPSTSKRAALLDQIQNRMLEDLPYFPLWFGTQTLIVRSDLVQGRSQSELEPLISRSAALETVVRIFSK